MLSSPQDDNPVQDAVGHFPLRKLRQLLNPPLAIEHGDARGLAGEANANVVRDDQIQMLLLELLPGVFEEVFCFSGEADQDP